MADDVPDYFSKYISQVGEQSGDAPFFAYLESLNEVDWTDLCVDVVSTNGRALTIFEPRNEEELVARTASLLRRSSPIVQRMVARALQRCIDAHISGVDVRCSKDEAHSLFSLAALLGAGVDPQAYVTIANDPHVSADYRVEAGRVIASHATDAPRSLWQQLDLILTPALAPVVLMGLARHDLREAMAAVADVTVPDEDVAAMTVALRDVLLRIVRESGPTTLHKAMYASLASQSKEIVADLGREYPELGIYDELPSQIVRDELWRLEQTGEIARQAYDENVESVYEAMDQSYLLPIDPANDVYNKSVALAATRAVLTLLTPIVPVGAIATVFDAVCRRILEKRGFSLSQEKMNDLVSTATNSYSNEASFTVGPDDLIPVQDAE
jgi:hypothetical protein